MKTEASKRAGSNKGKAMAKVPLEEIGWNDKHRESFERVKELVQRTVELVHPESDKTFCLYSDASDEHWAIALTQIPDEHLALPVDK
jgi:hypothetical protein